MSSGVILLQRPYISFSSPLLLILRREITTAAVALLLYTVQPQLSEPHGRHTIRSDNRGVRIDEGSLNKL